jgi:signal transduction histidine kinase/ActR/RegA family two-component response regulator
MIAAVAVVLLLSISPRQASQGPLYVNLTDFPVYARNGFDADALGAPPERDSEVWRLVSGGEAGVSSMVAPYIGLDETDRFFLSPFREPEREYTFTIPFEMGAADIDAMYGAGAVTPGFYLAGIGDNWQIYLNGDLIRSEWHLDENGVILSHRSHRGVAVPADRDMLREGTNFLTLRVVGAPSSGYTGLFYTSPYYLGDYTSVLWRSVDALTLIFCTVYLFVGLYHLLLYSMRRNETYNLYYSMFSIFVGAYFFCRSPVIHLLIQNTNLTQRIEYALVYFIPFLLAAFIEHLNFKKTLRPTRVYGVFCSALIVLQSTLSIQFAGDALALWQVTFIAMVLYITGYDVVFTFFSSIKRHIVKLREDGREVSWPREIRADMRHTPLGNIFATVLLLAATTGFDALDSLFLHSGVMLTRYSFFLFTVGAAFILATHFGNLYEQVSRDNIELEATVRARTKELAEQVEIAESASRAKSDFMATMSHEIRTPLNAIIGLSDIELRKELPEHARESFRKIHGSGGILLGIINDILDISKIEAGNFEILPTDYETAEVIGAAVQLNIVRIGDKPIGFKLYVDESLPRGLHGDELRIKQILNNILSNAIKYTNSGTVGLHVSCERTGDAVSVTFAVSDTGIGIRREDMGRLFQEYSQLDSKANRKIEGTGLGLSITQKLTELMGGTIEVQSEYGKGSTFTVRLPQTVADGAPLGPGLAERLMEMRFDRETDANDGIPSENAGAGMFRGNVLVVDDVPINLDVAAGLLEPYGLTVDCVACGADAIELVRAGVPRYDMILMDHMMPEMDGIATTRIIRREIGTEYAKTVPIVALTANALAGNDELFMSQGFDGFISKPIDVDRMEEALNRWIPKTGEV